MRLSIDLRQKYLLITKFFTGIFCVTNRLLNILPYLTNYEMYSEYTYVDKR